MTDNNKSTHEYIQEIAFLKKQVVELESKVNAFQKVTNNLAKSEILFRGLYDNMPSGAAIYRVINDGSKGSDYIIEDFNAHSLNIEGKQRDEVVGKSLFDLRPNIDEFGLIPIFQKVWQTGITGYFPTTVYIDEEYSNWYENWVFKLSTGEIVAIYNDVTQRKNFEKALIKSELRYKKAEVLGNLGHWQYDVLTTQFSASDQTKRIYGFDLNSATFSPEEVESCIPEREKIHQALVDLIERNVKYDLEFDIISHDKGTRKIINSIAEVERDDSGNPIKVIGIIKDITERKKAEERLRENESKFRALFEQAAVGVARVDIDGNWLEVNKKLCDIVGYSYQELLTKTFQQITHPDDLEADLELFNKLLNDQIKTYSIEKRYFKKNGDIVWINLTASLVRDKNNKPDYFIAIIEDISIRKKSETELFKSEENLRIVFEAADNVAFVMTDLGGENTKILGFSPGAEKIFGYKANEVLGQKVAILHPPEVVESFFSMQQSLRDGIKEISGESILVRKSGERFFALFTIKPSFDSSGVLVGTVGVSIDISVLKNTEIQLKESENKFRLSIMESPFPVMLHAEDGEVLQINKVWTELTGYKFEEISRIELWTEKAYGQKKDVVKSYIDTLFSSDLKVHDGEYELLAKDGRKLIWDFSSAPLGELPDGRRLVISTAIDITERKKTEIELAQYREHLEKLVEERTVNLKESQALLFESEKLASIGELGAGVAHELNSPLAGILTLINSYVKEKNPESQEYEDLSDIQEACKYMSTVIKNLNEFSRKSTGVLIEINFNSVIEDTLIFSAYQLKQKTISLEKDFDQNLSLISAEKNKLQQIIINMITNAADAMSIGGVFRIKTRNIKDGEQSFIEITFSDNGCGIDKEKINKIFEPFYTTKRPGRGIGLGLSIVYNIIKEYNGTIEVVSELNKGTTFTVRLPV